MALDKTVSVDSFKTSFITSYLSEFKKEQPDAENEIVFMQRRNASKLAEDVVISVENFSKKYGIRDKSKIFGVLTEKISHGRM